MPSKAVHGDNGAGARTASPCSVPQAASADSGYVRKSSSPQRGATLRWLAGVQLMPLPLPYPALPVDPGGPQGRCTARQKRSASRTGSGRSRDRSGTRRLHKCTHACVGTPHMLAPCGLRGARGVVGGGQIHCSESANHGDTSGEVETVRPLGATAVPPFQAGALTKRPDDQPAACMLLPVGPKRSLQHMPIDAYGLCGRMTSHCR